MNKIYATKTPQEEDILAALEFSNKVENLEEEDEEGLLEIIEKYENLKPAQKELVPSNIKEKLIIPNN